MRPALPAVTVALATALGGCVAGDLGAADLAGGWAPLECDPAGAPSISRNAPLAPGLRGEAAEVARRIAGGLGDPVRAPAGERAWSTAQGGLLRLSLDARGAFYQALYEGPAAVDRAAVERLLSALRVDLDTVGFAEPGALDGDGHAVQLAAGQPLGWRMAGATWSPHGGPFSLVRFYDLSAAPAEPAVAAGEAAATAEAFSRCDAGATALEAEPMWLGALHDSLAHVVSVPHAAPPRDGCGDRYEQWVYVDAVTGAVLGAHEAPCA